MPRPSLPAFALAVLLIGAGSAGAQTADAVDQVSVNSPEGDSPG